MSRRPVVVRAVRVDKTFVHLTLPEVSILMDAPKTFMAGDKPNQPRYWRGELDTTTHQLYVDQVELTETDWTYQ